MSPSGVPPLSERQRADFSRDGWLVLRGAIPAARLEQLRAWVDQVCEWPHVGGPGMHHFEETDTGSSLARSEDLVPHHPGLAAFICEGDLLTWVGDLLGEPAVLYKEKINHKQPGGAGCGRGAQARSPGGNQPRRSRPRKTHTGRAPHVLGNPGGAGPPPAARHS